MISKVNAGLRRCLSHHRRLCDNIAELDKLFCQDEFLMNPRRLWQLIQQQQNRQDEILGSQEKSEARTDMDSRMGVLSSKECLLSQSQLPSKISKVIGRFFYKILLSVRPRVRRRVLSCLFPKI